MTVVEPSPAPASDAGPAVAARALDAVKTSGQGETAINALALPAAWR